MNGLHVVALLGRQSGVQQQLTHAQHAVHGGAYLVAYTGQKLGLGALLGASGGAVLALANTAREL